jgi:hypothetical protein
VLLAVDNAQHRKRREALWKARRRLGKRGGDAGSAEAMARGCSGMESRGMARGGRRTWLAGCRQCAAEEGDEGLRKVMRGRRKAKNQGKEVMASEGCGWE